MRQKPINVFSEGRHLQILRIIRNEKYIMLPVKVIVCLIAGIFLYFHEKEAGPDIVYRYQLSLYGIGNLMFLYLLLQGGQIKLNYLAVRISAYFLSLIDNLFLCYLIYFSGGEESLLFWFYCALLVRNAANFPSFIEQSVLNVMFLFFYVGVLFLAQDSWNFFMSELFITRIVLLIVVSFCGWGVLNLLRKMRQEFLAREEKAFREEKFYSQEKLATEVAHELKNPLGIINNAVFVLSKKLRPNASDPLVLRQLEIIEKEIQRSDRIITDLLGYARMRDGKINEVNVNEILEMAVSMVLELLPDHGAHIKVEKMFSSDMPRLWIDPGQLQQVFINIITNAVEALPHNGGIICLTTAYDSARQEIVAVVKDSGQGIPREEQLKVFDSFFTTKESGTGLGLAIAKNIIETYNGFISLESDPGQGTSFFIRFPVVISKAALRESMSDES